MTCDFRLTYLDPPDRQPDDNTHKLITVARSDFEAIIGVTGWAFLGRTPIGKWVAEKTSDLAFDATLNDLLDVLHSASVSLSRVQNRYKQHRRLTLVVGAIQGSQSVVCMLSNFENLRGRFLADGEEPGHELVSDITRPSSVQLFTAGSGAAFVHEDEKKRLEYLLRSGLSTPERIQEAMAGLNEQVAGRTTDVSQGCYAASQFATGFGQTRPFLVEQVGNFNPPAFHELFKRMGIVLNPKIRPDGTPEPIQMTSSSSFSYNPSPAWFREQFKLRPHDAELWNNFGTFKQGRGLVDEAIEAYEKALELDSKYYNAARNLANLLWSARGERTRALELFEVALENPDSTQRRETLALRADWAAFRDRDLDAAREYFAEAVVGDFMPSVSVLWSRMMLVFDPPEHLVTVEQLADQTLQTTPSDAMATTIKATCIWWLHGDLPAANSLIATSLEGYPKDQHLLATGIRLGVAANDLDLAESLLARLSKVIADEDSQLLLCYRVILGICRGNSLSDLIALFHGPGLDNAVSLALLLWAQERDEECEEIVACVARDALTYQGRIEFDVLQRLLHADVSSEYTDLAGHLLDPTTLRAISAHPELSESRRDRLNAVLDAIRA